MATQPQVLSLNDLAAFGGAPPSSSPVQPKTLTLKDLQGFGDSAKQEQPGFWDSFGKTITSGSPLNPGNWLDMAKSAIESPFSDEHFAAARQLADQLQSGKPGAALKTSFGLPQDNSAAAGTATGEVANAAIIAALTAGIVKGAGWAASKASPLVDAIKDPQMLKAALNAIPENKTSKGMVDALLAAYDKSQVARKAAGPVPVLRDAQSPAWANFPDPDIQAPRNLGSIPATILPSGRIPGKPVVAMPAPATAPRVPLWQQIKDLEEPGPSAPVSPVPAPSLPSGRIPGHSPAYEAQFTPSAGPKTELESLLENSIPEAKIKPAVTGNEPVVSTAHAPLDAALKAKDAQIALAMEDRARMAKALKIGNVLQESGIGLDHLEQMGPEHWDIAAKAAGVSAPSAVTILTIKDLMKMGAAAQ